MNEEMAGEAKKKVVKAWGKLLPFGAQVVASAAAYTVGVTATQVRSCLAPFSMHASAFHPLSAGIASTPVESRNIKELQHSGTHCTACKTDAHLVLPLHREAH
jgi:hypothetical protein